LEIHTKIYADIQNLKLNSDLQTPSIVFGLIFLAIAATIIHARINKKNTDALDFWILFISGLVGVIIGWFTLYSEHPAMSPNYNLLWAFPANLVFAWIWRIRKFRSISRYYFWLIAGLIIVSLLYGQVFNPAVYVIIACLLVWVAAHVFPTKK